MRFYTTQPISMKVSRGWSTSTMCEKKEFYERYRQSMKLTNRIAAF